jgi:hypothetical protein
MSLKLALLRHADGYLECPLIAVDRKSSVPLKMTRLTQGGPRRWQRGLNKGKVNTPHSFRTIQVFPEDLASALRQAERAAVDRPQRGSRLVARTRAGQEEVPCSV